MLDTRANTRTIGSETLKAKTHSLEPETLVRRRPRPMWSSQGRLEIIYGSHMAPGGQTRLYAKCEAK